MKRGARPTRLFSLILVPLHRQSCGLGAGLPLNVLRIIIGNNGQVVLRPDQSHLPPGSEG